MTFPARRRGCWCAVLLAVSCSLDDRNPRVAAAECEPDVDAPRCDGDFVQRCSAEGAWQRDGMACELGCQGGACVAAVACDRDGDDCDDGSACTNDDRCESGTCSGTPVSCPGDQSCVESTGLCEASTSACSSSGQLVCVDGSVHECDASLAPSRLVQTCDIGCDAAAAPVACSYALTLGVARLAVVQGASASVELTLVRGDDHARPVEVSVLGLPPGVSAPALALSGSDDFATLTLSAELQASEGVPTPLTVRASDGFSNVEQELELFVRGEPGSLDLSFGTGGTARAAPPGAPGFQGTRVAVDGGDRILVAATSRFVLDPLDVPARASLTRFAPDGALDTEFADGGTYLETPGSGSLAEGPTTFLGDVAIAPDGYVLVGPLGEGVIQEASFLTRLTAAGERAPDFAAPTLGGGLRLTDVAVEGDTIFAVGEELSTAALYRTDLNGEGGTEFVDSNILSPMQAVFWSPADNDFILAGNCDPNACFARFDPDRVPPQLLLNRITALSPSFAAIVEARADAQGRYFAIANGWNLVRFLPEVVRPPGAAAFSVEVDELAAGSSSPQGLELAGNYLYVGTALPDPDSETSIPSVVRYGATWARDASFADAGLAQLDGEVEVGSSVDVGVQSDGRVIVATVEAGELVVYRVWD